MEKIHLQKRKLEKKNIKTQASEIREKGEKGIQIVNSVKRYVNKILPENVKAQTSFNGKRFRRCFKIKDRTKFEN